MNKLIVKRKLGRKKSHREALIQNQIRSLFSSGYVVTTTPKAKVLKSNAEVFMSKGKEEDLEFSRYIHTILGKKDLVKKVREYLKKGEKKVSISKVGFRDGDLGEKSKVVLVGFDKVFAPKKEDKEETKKKKVVKKSEDKSVVEQKDIKEDVEKDRDKDKGSVNKGLMNRLNTDLKTKFNKKERARSRAGL